MVIGPIAIYVNCPPFFLEVRKVILECWKTIKNKLLVLIGGKYVY